MMATNKETNNKALSDVQLAATILCIKRSIVKPFNLCIIINHDPHQSINKCKSAAVGGITKYFFAK